MSGDSEEQWQCLGSRNQEDAGSDNHHDLLLDILLLVVHGDIDANRAYDGHDAGDGIAELDDDGHILGDFLRNAQYLHKSLIYSIDF